MVHPPYFTTHFDLAFPLPILFSVDDFWEAQNIFMMSDSILLAKERVQDQEMEHFKFQLNSGEISAKTSCKNLFFCIFPEMIS